MTAGTISLQGQGAIGVEASNKGTVNLDGSAVPNFAADGSGITDQIAFRIIGDGATIKTNIAAELCWMLVGNVLYFSVLKMGQNRPALC